MWVFADLVVLLQASVQLLKAIQVKLLLQLGRLAQVLQHLLREATREAAADLIDHGGFQPHVPLSQQPVAQVVPAERESCWFSCWLRRSVISLVCSSVSFVQTCRSVQRCWRAPDPTGRASAPETAAAALESPRCRTPLGWPGSSDRCTERSARSPAASHCTGQLKPV